MKSIAITIILVLISLQSFSQINTDRALYEQKVIKYTSMKKTGTALTVAGGILTVVGIAVLSNSYVETYDDGNGNVTETTHGNPGLGAVTFLLGSAGLGAGIPLAIVGSKSQKKYEQKIKSLSFNFKVKPNNTGLVLTYRF